MGVILKQVNRRFFIRQLLPRYGGYSLYTFNFSYDTLVASPLWGLFSFRPPTAPKPCKLLPRYGGYSQFDYLQMAHNKLLPRYGGYSVSFRHDERTPKGCFPVMGIIPSGLTLTDNLIKLLPRYGGYSWVTFWLSKCIRVASPLWGLFSHHMVGKGHPLCCFPVMGVILASLPPKGTKSLLLSRYGGYSVTPTMG